MQLALPGPVDHAWEALTDGEHTICWLGRLDVTTITEGGVFDLWHDEGVRSRHTVLQWRPRHVLALTWDFPDEQPSRVTFTLTAANSATATLTVHHEHLEDPVPYAAGWHRHLQYLEAYLRGGALPMADFWTGYDNLVELYESNA